MPNQEEMYKNWPSNLNVSINVLDTLFKHGY